MSYAADMGAGEYWVSRGTSAFEGIMKQPDRAQGYTWGKGGGARVVSSIIIQQQWSKVVVGGCRGCTGT